MDYIAFPRREAFDSGKREKVFSTDQIYCLEDDNIYRVTGLNNLGGLDLEVVNSGSRVHKKLRKWVGRGIFNTPNSSCLFFEENIIDIFRKTS